MPFIYLCAIAGSFGCTQSPHKQLTGNGNPGKESSSKKLYADYAKEADTSYDATSSEESYRTDCQFESENHISFPTQTPAYAIVHINDFKSGKPKLLKPDELNNIIKAVNDTSSYEWGELTTPYFDKYITFHNKTGRCIAILNISYDYDIEARPSTAKMKYGHLTGKGMDAIKSILEQK